MEKVSKETLKRMPNYMRVLTSLKKQNIVNVSSTVIAEYLNLNPVQVRKDLASVSLKAGKPKTGFSVNELIHDISSFLGYNDVSEAVLVGVGHLGRALLNYSSFSKFGLEIVAAFDAYAIDDETIKKEFPILKMEELPTVVKENGIHMGIITVPKENAQSVCDMMVQAGIRAIWNFAPIRLVVPSNVALKSEDMAASLAVLSNRLYEIMKNENQ